MDKQPFTGSFPILAPTHCSLLANIALMSTVHPKYRFQHPTVPSIRYGSPHLFSDFQSLNTGIQRFSELFFAHLQTLGLMDFQHTVSRYNTGGHSDIDYCALVLISDDGGCECPFHTIGWTGDYEAMTPWVQLYGSWETHHESLSRFLNEQFPSQGKHRPRL